MRVFTTGVVVLGLLVGVGAGTASAHKKKFGSSLTLDAIDKKDAAGTVGSTKNRCVRNRKVKVFRQPAAGEIGSPELVATTTSDLVGKWATQLTGKTKGETFFATTPGKVLRKNRRHKHKCKRAVSGTLTAPEKRG